MTAGRGALDWRHAAAVSIGVAHRRHHQPCQDAGGAFAAPGRPGPLLVLVAADGAGSAQRGGDGAEGAVEETRRWVQRCWRARRLDALLGPLRPGAADGLAQELARDLVQAVRDHLEHEARWALQRPEAYATTLLAAIAGPRHCLFIQLGDGGIVAQARSAMVPARATAPVWMPVFRPQRGAFVNETVFVTDRRAVHLVQARLMHAPRAIALFTDGLEPLLLTPDGGAAHQPFFDKVALLLERGGGAEAERQLQRLLDSDLINRRTHDDKALVVALWRPQAAETGDPPRR